MPQAIPFALAYAASNAAAVLGASVAAQATVAAAASSSIAVTIATTAASVAASYAVSKLLAPKTTQPSNQKSEFRQALPHCVMHYGTVQVGGPLAFLDTNLDDSFEYSQFKVVLISARKIAAYRTLVLGGIAVTVDPTTARVNDGHFNTSGPGLARISVHLGEDDQVADPHLLYYYEGVGTWTTDHRLRGTAYAMIQYYGAHLDQFNDVWGGQLPEFTPIIDGALVYDPRLDGTRGGTGPHREDDPDTWEFSDNAALCVLDWLRWKDGYAFPIGIFNLSIWRHAADLCDEEVALKAGGTEKRYRVALSIDLAETPKKTVLSQLLAAFDGQLYFDADGLLCVRGGEWVEPTVTIVAERDTVQSSFVNGPPALSRFNELTLKFLSTATETYEETEGQSWRDEDAIAAEGDVVITKQIDLTQVPSFSQARRLAKIAMKKGNPIWKGAVTTNWGGITAIGESIVNLTWDELDGGSDKFNGPFFVEPGMAMKEDGTGLTIPLSSADPTTYEWDASTEEGDAPDAGPPVPAHILDDNVNRLFDDNGRYLTMLAA